jgi:hypothetical protein
MATLAISCDSGGVLGTVAPLALAAASSSVLVVDLDRNGPHYPGGSSLAELVEQSPRLSDLRPSKSGIAVLRNGGIDPSEAGEVVQALVSGWPNVVLRLPRFAASGSVPIVPVVPLLPGGMTPACDRPAVYQQMGWHEKAPGPAIVLPTPTRASVRALLEARIPLRSRWVRSWRKVWEHTWA